MSESNDNKFINAEINPISQNGFTSQFMIDSYSSGFKNQNRKVTDEAKKKRNEYEFIDGSYLTVAEAKFRRKTKKSKGGKSGKTSDFPISGISAATELKPSDSRKNFADLYLSSKMKKNNKNEKKQKKQQKPAAIKPARSAKEFYGYSELEAILKADDSIINDPDKGILEWADSVLNPEKILNFSNFELYADNNNDIDEDGDEKESEIFDVSENDDQDDEEEGYIPSKTNQQHRVGVCPKCSSTQKLINFVWECECSAAKSEEDISEKFFGIVNDWTQNSVYYGSPQGGKTYGNTNVATEKQKNVYPFNASKNKKNSNRGKIYEKKNLHYPRVRKDINILTNQLEAVSINQPPTTTTSQPKNKPSFLQTLRLQRPSIMAPSRSSPPNKKPILRSLLQDDPTWAMPNSINFSPPTTFYDLIYETDDSSSIHRKNYAEVLGLTQQSSAKNAASADDAPLLRALLTKPSKATAPKITTTQTFQFNEDSESPSTSEFRKLKAELEQEKVHRMAVEGKVAALEMKFSQCLSLIENTLPNITERLQNISLTCDHINNICENTKAEKQSAMDELAAAKEKIEKLEKEHAKFQQQKISFKGGDSKTAKATVSIMKDDSKNVEFINEMEKELLNELIANDTDDDDKDSEYSFVY
uniref:Uncharacterized protein n=1 Tax=Panagrolaimus sp. ES5 TaxID=591445 RepID=A0AC34F3H5_9BILA